MEETPESFTQNYTSWHKYCRVNLYDGKLSRAKKRKEREQDPENEKGKKQFKKTPLHVAKKKNLLIKKSFDKLRNASCHSLERETPLPVYIGLNIHALSRCKKLIQQLFQLCISVSYDRVMELEEMIAKSSCELFKENVVAPASLRNGVFTVGALDNLDHNTSATTALNSFHGTGISLFQLITEENRGQERESITFPPSKDLDHLLPEEYSFVKAVSLQM